jgi:hypothetical protein
LQTGTYVKTTQLLAPRDAKFPEIFLFHRAANRPKFPQPPRSKACAPLACLMPGYY